MLEEGKCVQKYSDRSTFKKIHIFIDYAITVVPIIPHFSPSVRYPPFPPASPPTHTLSSCPWVVQVTFLVSPFPILFLTSPCLFCTYHLYFLFSVPSLFPHSPPTPFLLINPPYDLHFCDSVPVLVVCLVSVSYTHLTLPTIHVLCRSRWSPYH